MPVSQCFSEECVDRWINFDKEIVQQEMTVNTVFCLRKNTVHDGLLECDQAHFSRKSLRTVFQGDRYIYHRDTYRQPRNYCV